MDTIQEKINSIEDAQQIKQVLIDVISFYITPAFGTVKQREFDIFLFGKLEELGLFSNKDDIYEVVSKLKVTRSKARSLIYENNLRKLNSNQLDLELKNALKSARFLSSDKYLIGLEIDNPLLIDHLKAKLKTKGFASDGSFSPEIIKLSGDALSSLIEEYLDEEKKKVIEKRLVEIGFEEDRSFVGLIKNYINHAAQQIAGHAGEILVTEYIEPLLDGAVEKLKMLNKIKE